MAKETQEEKINQFINKVIRLSNGYHLTNGDRLFAFSCLLYQVAEQIGGENDKAIRVVLDSAIQAIMKTNDEDPPKTH